jgi:hypothetical protein
MSPDWWFLYIKSKSHKQVIAFDYKHVPQLSWVVQICLPVLPHMYFSAFLMLLWSASFKPMHGNTTVVRLTLLFKGFFSYKLERVTFTCLIHH